MMLSFDLRRLRQIGGRCNDLHRHLMLQGISVVGVSQDRIDFAPEVDPAMQATAEALRLGWNWESIPVPEEVTSTQAKLALIEDGLYETVEIAVMSASGDDGTRYRIVWNASHWYRSSEDLNNMAASLQLSSEKVDDLFRLAATK